MSLYELHNQDCINFHTTKIIDLVYTDPPYGSIKEDSWYGVGNNLDEYLEFMSKRLTHIKNFLSKDANVLVHVDWKAVHYLKVEMDKIFGVDNFRNEIIWGFSNPTASKRWLGRKHQNILWYGIGNYVFNQPRVAYSGKLNVGGKTGWSDKKDTTTYLTNGKPLEDWWVDIPALCRNEKEKTGYATQKPLKLLDRIIATFSNEKQTVFDPFMGSGTTLESAINNKRYAIGCDKSKEAYDIVEKRLACHQ